MPVTIPSLPQQVAPPGLYSQRVFVDTTVRVDNEEGTVSVAVSYEVQEHHAAAGYRVVQGGSRVEDLQVGTNVLRHWFVLDGPPVPPARLNVVDMRVRAQASNQSRRGFAALMQ